MNRCRLIANWIGMGVVALAFSGCVTNNGTAADVTSRNSSKHGATAPPPRVGGYGTRELSAAEREQIYRRADATFTNVILFKPIPVAGTNSEMFNLAPLILKQTAAAPGAVEIETNGDEILFAHRTIEIAGRPHRQLAYYWFAKAGRDFEDRRSLQGVRITLGSDGYPAVWEVLNDPIGARIVFVSDSVEGAAAFQFGKALPGRRFVVERGLSEAPDVMVARVIGDGPIPMGPIIYQRGDSREIQTLICRCMPSQAKRVVEQIYFKLKPINPAAERAAVAGEYNPAGSSGVSVENWFDPRRLEQLLRLPEKF